MSRTSKITALYERLSRDDDLNGESNSITIRKNTSKIMPVGMVLRKSVSTNFKLHKRKTTDEDQQYVFYNTHEPIISQELWDSVQKRKKRVNRAATRGTHNQPIKRLSVLCRLWQKIDLADTLQQKRPLLAVFVPLRWLCEQGKFLYCSFNKC